MSVAHDELVKRAYRWLYNTRRCSLVFTELCTHEGERPDAIGWYGHGWSVLVECKVSVSDFLSDRRKPFRNGTIVGVGQERWYMVPQGLDVKNSHIPDGWGLLVVGKQVRRHRDAADYDGASWQSRREPIHPDRSAAEIRLMISAFYNRTQFKEGDLPFLQSAERDPTPNNPERGGEA